ncbi:DNA repair protein RadA [Peptoniphilus sp. MSJ-1]|uniref:DNA repair protein RadA n=1 Tax=Peptoniphilus ovalis TaxID=2841503 RepID=A0ABS6FFP4_9FIRM|nr:DNA repair protein RadA [Peptoniphilus ovalis]MBU5668975.1 DNA repair protein RadA [Peptoniphilus ovalis]
MKKKTVYQCSDCGYISHGYFGKCPNCGAWNTLEEKEEETGNKSSSKKKSNKDALKLSSVKISSDERIKTDIEEFNRVMGGGIVRDSVSILTAKPGSGKSTLLMQVANDLANKGLKVLYASGEESETQIKMRAERILDKLSDNIWVYSTTSLNSVLDQVDKIDPSFIIIDSIQTFTLDEFTQRPGTPTQTMECAYKMTEIAKDINKPRMVFLVGQMTKQDELAGVRSLEHLVDTVLLIEGESSEDLRSLMATKNRYGSTGEIGFFSMTEKGMLSIDNPSEYFMTKREGNAEVPGSSLSVIREGTRPIILETEALASKTFLPYPSRISECLQKDQLNTLVSILEERAGIKFLDKNIVVKTTGGIKLKEQAANLSVMVSIVSSTLNQSVEQNSVFIADVGLTGELKNVPSLEPRLREVERMGFKKAYVSKYANVKIENYKTLEIRKVSNILELLKEVFKLK